MTVSILHFLGISELTARTGDLIQAIVRVSNRLQPFTYVQQDSCTARDETRIIAAGVSERGSETTVKIWISTTKPPPLPSSPPPKESDAPRQDTAVVMTFVTTFRRVLLTSIPL